MINYGRFAIDAVGFCRFKILPKMQNDLMSKQLKNEDISI